MQSNSLDIQNYNEILESRDDLIQENQRLLSELELAYKSMEHIVEESNREKEIAYSELQNKFEALEQLYAQLSKKENMLIHMEKLSSIGQFITELIHELSSPLTAISLQSQLAVMKDISDEVKNQFKIISEHAERMSNLLSRFKAMAYKGKEDFIIFDLKDNLAECIGTIEIIKPKHITIKTELCEDKLPVKGDPYQTNQVYLNLSKNAFDAMKNNGKEFLVRLRKMSSKELQESNIFGDVYCQPQSDWYEILKNTAQFALAEFIDQGSGIPPEILKEIFQPFFTTKERGKGTGLGLHISSDISLRHGGNLAVKSKVGSGTTFQFILPIASHST